MSDRVTFVLGAGFSAAACFPLLRRQGAVDLTERVVHFMRAERNPSYATHLDRSDEFPEGQLLEGIKVVDPQLSLGFEELLVALTNHQGHDWSPHHLARHALRTGCERFLWMLQLHGIHDFSFYERFGAHVKTLIESGTDVSIVSLNWDLMAERALHANDLAWNYQQGPGIVVAKPHGSINWVDHKFIGATEIQQGVWFSTDKPFNNITEGQESHSQRVLVYPGDPETTAAATALKEQAARLIGQSGRVIFVGYSMPHYDQTAMEMFRSAVPGGAGVEVVDPSQETLDRYRGYWPHARLIPSTFEGSSYAQ